MLIVITHWNGLRNEANIIAQISEFDSTLIHVRKPGYSEAQMKRWMAQFSEDVTQKMVLHQHHQLSDCFPLAGLHFKEDNKLNLNRMLYSTDLKVSAAFHDKTKAQYQTQFDYSLLSPVFDSISKTRLKGEKYHVKTSKKPIIALGGIDAHNITAARSQGFHGVAVLGALWCSTNPLTAFKTIEKNYRQAYE